MSSAIVEGMSLIARAIGKSAATDPIDIRIREVVVVKKGRKYFTVAPPEHVEDKTWHVQFKLFDWKPKVNFEPDAILYSDIESLFADVRMERFLKRKYEDVKERDEKR